MKRVIRMFLIAKNVLFSSADTPPGAVVDGNLVTSGTCPMMAEEYSMKAGTGELMARSVNLLPARK